MATRYASRLDQDRAPFSWFADPGVFRDERRRIFARSWHAGVGDWVEQPG
jgi:hypothetical protein